LRIFQFSHHLSVKVILVLLCLAILTIAGCNLPGDVQDSSKINVTQAYQTLNAGLTQAVAQIQTLTPTTEAAINTQVQNIETQSPPIVTTESTEEIITATLTSVPGDICDQAAAANPIDITIDDESEIPLGSPFTKIWRVINVGTCTWTTAYEIVFFSGELMGAFTEIPLTEEVLPGESTDLEVDMTAPENPGTYQGNWKLRNANGLLFGIGPGGESPFWVRINAVGEVSATPTLASSPSLTPTVEVQVSGSIIMGVGDTLDLDNLLVNSGGADLLQRIAVIDPQHQIVPLPAVRLGLFGTSEPELSDCQVGGLGSSTFNIEELPVGTYLCYRTNLGLPGWARLDYFDQDTGEATWQIFTWKLP